MQCPRCQQEAPLDSEYCPECGAKLALTCSQCGIANAPGHKFCKKCGQPLSAPRPSDQTVPRFDSSPRAPQEAERRQLTVMFCDLVGSTALSERLDPEELRDLVRGYQQACAEVIHKFEGHIAQYLGDGLLVYFSYPQAHEDDAERAVHAALGIVDRVRRLPGTPRQTAALSVRVGIHTGPVVVGDIGAGARHQALALGETPNLAARLQAIAEPDTVVISAATQRLLHDLFVLRDLGPQTLKGLSTPVKAYRVLEESEARSRLEVAATSGLTPLVGRQEEVGLLLRRWEQATDGAGQVILLAGEPGIGKSRLVQVVKDRVASVPHRRLECRCSPYYQHTPLYPVIDLLPRLLEWTRDDAPATKFGKLERGLAQYPVIQAEVVPLLAALLSLPPAERYPLPPMSPELQKRKTLAAFLGALHAMAAAEPLLLIVEDLHWVDPTTLELLTLLLDQAPTSRVLVLLTARPAFVPSWTPRSHLTQLALTRLAHRQTSAMLAAVTGRKKLPAEVIEQIITKTDGVPLFIEELTKMVLESGLLRQQDDRYELKGPLPPLAIPATLQDSLMARLDRLATVKDVAQLGAILGRSFSYELLLAVSPVDEATLQRALGRLAEAELLYQRGVPPDAVYTFKHALIQEAAYQSLLKSRRHQFHQRIAQVLVERFSETSVIQPELVAHHYTEAGLTEQAIFYWHKAGERAVERSANLEAIAHLTKALELLKTLPDTRERAQQELALQITLGAPLIGAKGYAAPEVEKAFARAQALCQQVGETPQLFRVLWGLWAFYLVRAELETTRNLVAQLFGLAERSGDRALLLAGHHAVGETFYFVGDFLPARVHLEQGIALYNGSEHHSLAFVYGQDPGVNCLNFTAHTLWYLGYPDQALARIQESLALARTLSHPFSLAFALVFAAWLHQYRREPELTAKLAEAALAHSTEHGIAFFLALSRMLRGWALVRLGQGEHGIEQIRQGLQTRVGSDSDPHWLSLLAEAHADGGRVDEALHIIAEARGAVHKSGMRFSEAELLRLKGDLLLKRAVPEEASADTSYHEAIQIARSQQAKSLELRAVTSLSRLWKRQSKREEARRMLAGVYDWFTEGFDTADLREAKILLDELAVG